LKILIVTELWPPNGGSFVFEHVRAMTKFAHIDVAVLVPIVPRLSRYRTNQSPFTELARQSGPHRIAELGEDTAIHYLPYRTIPEFSKYLNSWQARRVLVNFLRRHPKRFDIIHAHFAYTVGFAAACAGQRFHIPVVITAHNSDVNFYTLLKPRNFVAALFTIWGLRHVAVVNVVSADLKKKVLALGVPEHKIAVIPVGVPGSIFRRRGEKKHVRGELGLSENDIIFLFVGYLIPRKGGQFLLKAFAHVCKQLSLELATKTMLIMIGSGALEGEWKQLAKDLGIERRVIWLGTKPNSEISSCMNAADFLVLPSLGEGTPTVIMESLACGTPVIASRVGGIPDILVSPDFGMMVPPADSEALAHAMLEAIDKPVNKEKILAYGQTHTWNERIKQLLSLYQSVLSRHTIPHPNTKAKR